MREYLQGWYDKWLDENRETDLLYAKGGGRVQLSQVHFVRDALAPLVWSDIKYDARAKESPRDDRPVTAMVIGEHSSKSVRLPVFSFERPDLGIQFVLRTNYHDWNVSVVAEKPVNADLRGFVTDFWGEKEREKWEPGGYWGYCFFQGFPHEFFFGPYANDRRRFSTYMSNDYELYAFVRLVLQELRP